MKPFERCGAWTLVCVTGLGLIASTPVGAREGGALGTLTGKGTINLGSKLGTSAVRNPNLPYESGAQVVTAPNRSTTATVNMPEGSVRLRESTDASVTGQEGDYQVKLERGSVRTRFEEGTRFEVQAKDARVRPVENPSTSATEASVTITSTGKLHVRSYAGTFEIVDRNGDRQGTIPPGASAVIGVSQTTGLQLAGGAGSAAGGISTMEVLLYGGGAAAVVGGGVAAGVLLSDDDDDGSPSGP